MQLTSLWGKYACSLLKTAIFDVQRNYEGAFKNSFVYCQWTYECQMVHTSHNLVSIVPDQRFTPIDTVSLVLFLSSVFSWPLGQFLGRSSDAKSFRN